MEHFKKLELWVLKRNLSRSFYALVYWFTFINQTCNLSWDHHHQTTSSFSTQLIILHSKHISKCSHKQTSFHLEQIPVADPLQKNLRAPTFFLNFHICSSKKNIGQSNNLFQIQNQVKKIHLYSKNFRLFNFLGDKLFSWPSLLTSLLFQNIQFQ